tara:strand:- start:5140 stop:5388 length:249 start_codon:yes stop_codon:yes gene_type:complete
VRAFFCFFYLSATCRAPPPDPLAKRTAHRDPWSVIAKTYRRSCDPVPIPADPRPKTRPTIDRAYRSALRGPPPPVGDPRAVV